MARNAGRAVLAAVGLGLVLGAVVFAAAVGSPRAFASDQWKTFKHNEEVKVETHFTDLGSNRYDFWRVALAQFGGHPVAGVGARGFGALYLQHRSVRAETPRRAHSLELDSLMELGIVGFALLVLALGAPLIAIARKVRRPSAAAALAGCVLWLTDATVDWIWTLPAAGLPFFVLLGIGASEDERRRLVGRLALLGAVAAAAAAVLFAPPWLAGRFEARATRPSDLRWAQRLDPFSADPYLVEARLTPAPASLEAYRKAVAREPRRAEVRYEYGVVLLNAGRKREARVQLEEAVRLWPGQRAFAQALRMTG
jgi:O-antigen ligase